MIWWLAVALLAAGFPVIAERLRRPVDDTLRAKAPGRFAALPGGATHYRWYGPSKGPVAVCVHGLTTPSFVYERLARLMGERGWRVLSYDLYGRGYSDRPRGAQDAAFFAAQLDELLADQQLEDGFALVGYSMGGAIAAAYTARHPGRLLRLVLLASAGLGHDLGPIARFVRGVPVLGDWIFHIAYPQQLRRGIALDEAAGLAPGPMAERQREELRRRGFLRAVLSSIRGMLRADLTEDHIRIAAAGIPVLAIWGADDKVIPLTGKGTLAALIPEAEQHVIAGAGHAVTYTNADRIADLIGPPA